MSRLLLAILVLLLGGNAEAQVANQANSCEAVVSMVEQSIEGGHLSEGRRLYSQAQDRCPNTEYPSVSRCLGRRLAFAHLLAAQSSPDANIATRIATLKTGQKFGQPWQMLAYRAELEEERQRYAASEMAYEQAIEEFANINPCEGEEQLIAEMKEQERLQTAKKLWTGATANLLRTKRLPPEVTYRCCEPSGVLRDDIRGYRPESHTFRIDFVKGSVRLARDGERGLQRLVQYLKERKITSAQIEIHTESFGSEKIACLVATKRGKLILLRVKAAIPDAKLKAIPSGSNKPLIYDEMPIFHARVELPRGEGVRALGHCVAQD